MTQYTKHFACPNCHHRHDSSGVTIKSNCASCHTEMVIAGYSDEKGNKIDGPPVQEGTS